MMNMVLLAFFLVPLLAGVVVQFRPPGPRWSRLLLSFGGAFLLGVAVMHMLPELYAEGGEGIGVWLLGGFLLQVIMEHFSHGLEHGHMHAWKGSVVPTTMMISLGLHAFVEGLPFADAEVAADMPFVAGVLLHKFPMALALATVIRNSGVAVGKGWMLLLGFALAAPLGMLLGYQLPAEVAEVWLVRLLAVAIGMLLHISTTIIFESAPEHRFNTARSAAVLLGALLSLLAVH